MKYVASVVVLLSACLAGCEEENRKAAGKIADSTREIVEIDECEYIRQLSRTHSGYYVESITHKGNCKNPIHQYAERGVEK